MVSLRPSTAMAFQDLALWIQAFQRRTLQEARDTLPQPDRVKIFIPPALGGEEKYPRVELKRETDTNKDTSGGETPFE